MEDFFTPIKLWLANPIVGKLIAVGIGILVINFIFRVLSRSLPRYIQDSDARYRIRKAIAY